MPSRAPTICPTCGVPVPGGQRCECRRRGDAERKARFDRRRPSSSARGYDRQWEEARKRFLATNGACAWPGCREDATVVDHKIPHRGDAGLFWDRTNWQPLCQHHHNSAKQREERAK